MDASVVGQEGMVKDYGRIRDVAEGPDGYLYFRLQTAMGEGSRRKMMIGSCGSCRQ
jgi:hypothetical protein